LRKLTVVTAILGVIGAVWADDTNDVDVYTDYLCGVWAVNPLNGAQATLQNTERSHSPNYAIKAVMPAATTLEITHTWEGQDVTGFQCLEFWVYPSQSGFNQFTITPIVWGNPRTTVTLSSVTNAPANTWTRVRVPFSSLGCGSGDRVKWFYLKAPTGAATMTLWIDDIKVVKSAFTGTTLVNITPSNVIRTLSKRAFGVGTSAWDWHLSNPATLTKVQEAGLTFMNFPGGSASDEYDWANNRNRRNGAPAGITFDQWVQVANTVGADKMVTVNYGSGTPQEAADWLRYANQTLNANILYWSIGNESYYSEQYDIRPSPYAHDAETYAAFVRDCIISMKAIDPRIKIGIVGTIAPWDWPQRTTVINPRTGQPENGWGPVVLTRLREWGTMPDYYDFHLYTIAPGSESDSTALQMASRINWMMTLVRPMLRDYLGATGDTLPVSICETNSTWMPAGKQSVSMTNGLYMADYWGHAMKAGMDAFVWWNLHDSTVTDGNMSPTVSGWRNFGTFGMLSSGQPVGLADPLNTPYPTFYVAKLLKQFARPGDSLVQVSSNNELLSVYASKQAGTGKLRLLVINRAKLSDITASFGWLAFGQPTSAVVSRYGMAEDQALTGIVSTSVNITRPRFSTNSAKVLMTFPRYSVTVVEF
jgi:alpha-N-arabinofuranosidase